MSEFVHYNISVSHSFPKELKTALSSSEANFVDVNWFAISSVVVRLDIRNKSCNCFNSLAAVGPA